MLCQELGDIVKIIENPEIERYVLDRLKSVRKDKSIHVTDLIYCLRKAWYRIKGFDPIITDASIIATGSGRGLHEVLEVAPLKEVPVEKDGIRGSIDMIADRVTEIKTTRHRLDVKDSWIRQIKSYLYMVGETEADLLVVDISGMRVKGYRLVFTKDEIENHWKWMLERKRTLEKYLDENTPPPAMPEYGWECLYCPYRYICRREEDVDLSLLGVMPE